MQALGGYRGGRMLFLGFGTGLGSALIVDGVIEAMELGHLPFRKGVYEEYVSASALAQHGKRRWRKHVNEIIEHLRAALMPEDILLGGGNAKKLKNLPPHCRLGDNVNAFTGGFAMWRDENRTN